YKENSPIYIAEKEEVIVGFACYDVTIASLHLSHDFVSPCPLDQTILSFLSLHHNKQNLLSLLLFHLFI
ncbi:hypothetical protein ACT453_56765, partial [Bacillus sp. D-CC]